MEQCTKVVVVGGGGAEKYEKNQEWCLRSQGTVVLFIKHRVKHECIFIQ